MWKLFNIGISTFQIILTNASKFPECELPVLSLEEVITIVQASIHMHLVPKELGPDCSSVSI